MNFEHELETLRENMDAMGKGIQQAFADLLSAIALNDLEELDRIQKNDRKINEMERKIEAECLLLLTRQQPVLASDLRIVSSVMTAVGDMERIGDHAADIADMAVRLNGISYKEYAPSMPEMLEETRKILCDGVELFMADGSSVGHGPCDEIIIAQEPVRLFHIALLQHLPHIGAADDGSVCIPFLFYHKKLVAIFRRQFFQKSPVSCGLVAKMTVRPGDDDPGVHPSRQDLLYKLLRGHVAYLLVKGIFHQIIHPGRAQELHPLPVGHEDGLLPAAHQAQGRRGKREHRHL